MNRNVAARELDQVTGTAREECRFGMRLSHILLERQGQVFVVFEHGRAEGLSALAG